MIIPFGAWEPDSASVGMKDGAGRSLMEEARNVWPTKTGYAPIPALSVFDASHTLTGTCLGMFVGHTSANGHVLFVGTQTKLYKYDSTNGFVDYTRTAGGDYGVPSGDYWSATQFGSQVIFANQNNEPQVIDIDTGATAFANLGGSPPNSRYVTVVGDFVVLACQSANPRRIVNSAINDATGWTVGTNFCDQQDFADGERITGLAGGEFGWVTQEHAIRRMIFQPGFDQAFRFERMESEHGNVSGYGLAAVGRSIFFPSDDGFYSFSAENGLRPIGHERVNDWFRDNSDPSRFFSVLAFTDPFAPRVGWAFFNSGSSTTPDRVLFYDWHLDQFSYSTQAAQFWARQVTSGTTLEALDVYGDIDSGLIPYPFDSRAWEGGAPVIAAITTSGTLAFLNGTAAMTALLRTIPMQLSPSQRTAMHLVYPIGEFMDATVTMRVGARENTLSSVSYTGSLSPSSRTGIVYARKGGRVHNFEQTIAQSSGTRWTHAAGLDLIGVPDGAR